ncbi:hypothetical protein WCLP8_1840008 [uncultured Gammaproteobacteria bacterium]
MRERSSGRPPFASVGLLIATPTIRFLRNALERLAISFGSHELAVGTIPLHVLLCTRVVGLAAVTDRANAIIIPGVLRHALSP